MVELSHFNKGKCSVVGCNVSHHNRNAINTKFKVCNRHFHELFEQYKNSLKADQKEQRFINLPEDLHYIIYDNDLSFSEKVAKLEGDEADYKCVVVGDC